MCQTIQDALPEVTTRSGRSTRVPERYSAIKVDMVKRSDSFESGSITDDDENIDEDDEEDDEEEDIQGA